MTEWIDFIIPVDYMLYNRPNDADEMKSTIEGLWSLFVNRSDCFLTQKEGGAWIKSNIALSKNDIRRHVRGEKTIGLYQIDPSSDKVKWGCFDIDNHNNESSDSCYNMNKLKSYLEMKEIPFMVEASGSQDSYHIWLFFALTPTRYAYNFMHRIVNELILNREIEIFPKQKSLDVGKFGNQVKLPLGKNLRSGSRSHLLNEKEHITKLIVLKNVPDIPYTILDFNNKNKPIEDLLFCQKEIIKERSQMEGGEGHSMRLAIAANAIKIGWSIDDIIGLFEHCEDFDRGYTLKTINYIKDKGYYCKCSWIQEHCWNLVKTKCGRCK